jgi:hypothetical protein
MRRFLTMAAVLALDDLTLAFTSNSTQDYPPDTAPEDAVQRALFTSVPFVRA